MSKRRVISIDLGTRSMALAHIEEPHTLLKWMIIDLRSNVAREAVETFHSLLEGELRWIRDCEDPIVVELQPREGVCKTVSHCLQMYSLVHTPRRRFVFMAANTKLKYDMALFRTMPRVSTDERKAITMTVTERLLVPDSAFSVFYKRQAYKQQTDLADAYVQGCKFLLSPHQNADFDDGQAE